MPDNFNLPSPDDEIKKLRLQEFIEKLKSPPWLYALLVVALLAIAGIGGGLYRLISGPTTPTPTAIAIVTPTPTVITTATPTLSDTTAVPPTDTPTASPTASLPTPSVEATTPEEPTPPVQPDPVTDFAATNAGRTSLTLNWTNPVGNYQKIILHRDGNPVGELPAGTQNHMVTGLTCGRSYVFVIVTMNEAGQSEPAEVTARTDDCPPPPPSPPTLTSTLNLADLSGQIAAPVFNSNTNTYDLYLAAAPDWEPKLFQPGASQPAFSPDGRQLVFRSWGGGQEITPYAEQLVIRKMDDSPGRLITTHPEDGRPDWGNFDFPILFHSRPAGQSARVYLQALWDDAPNNPDSRKELAIGENPTWLPDGRIVYISGEPEGNGLYVVNRDGSGIHLLWSTRVAPAGAPHTNQVVFSYNDDLYLLTITGDQSEPQPLLTTSNVRERLPAWSPDGQYIAYAKDHNDEQWAVYAIRADGSGEVKLFDLPGSIDGKPFNVPEGKSFGWLEEQLSWSK